MTWTFTVSGVTDTGYSYDPTTGSTTDLSGQRYTLTYTADPTLFPNQDFDGYQRIGSGLSSGPATVSLTVGSLTKNMVIDPSVGYHNGHIYLFDYLTRNGVGYDSVRLTPYGCTTPTCNGSFAITLNSLMYNPPTGLRSDYDQNWSRTFLDTDYRVANGGLFDGNGNLAFNDNDPIFASITSTRISVPEPQTLGMLLTGLCGLPLVWRRRRERRRC